MAEVMNFLPQKDMGKRDVSCSAKEIDAKWRVLNQTIAEAKGRFDDLSPDDLDALIGEAVAAARQPRG